MNHDKHKRATRTYAGLIMPVQHTIPFQMLCHVTLICQSSEYTRMIAIDSFNRQHIATIRTIQNEFEINCNGIKCLNVYSESTLNMI